jgi:dihydroneopterin aldolase/2-amino-4-hydroxy-6-hydroxymethyldihydropteridine diphosphokinase
MAESWTEVWAGDRIRLTGIGATGYHGVFDHERRDGQQFSADVELHVDTRPAAEQDRLDLGVDYGALAEGVAAVLAGEPADLIETVAERIAALALSDERVRAVDVVVHKPQAPVTVPVVDVSVAIHRDRAHMPVVQVPQGARTSPEPELPAFGEPEHAASAFPPVMPAFPPRMSAFPEPEPQALPEPEHAATAEAEPPAYAEPEPPVFGEPEDIASAFGPPMPAFAEPEPAFPAFPAAAFPPVFPVPEPAVPFAELISSAPLAGAAAAPLPVPDVAPAPAPGPAPHDAARDRLDLAPDGETDVVLALGSNVGASQDTLRQAVHDLAAIDGLQILAVGPLARTAPVGGPEQQDFLNTVVLGRTRLSPRGLLHTCQQVEERHGRVRGDRWGPRTLDVDVITFGTMVATADDLELPHPRASQRAFVLQPWSHLDPDAVLPGLGGGPVGALAQTAPDAAGIRWMALDWWGTEARP